jgi:RND family efflux transporter MFP subunit
MTISLGEAGRVRSFAGMAQSADEPRLSFRVPGTIIDLPVRVGDRVKQGQVIARIDPADYRLDVEAAEAALRQAQAEARNAAAAFRRTRDLYENGNASLTDYDSARTAAESSTAAVESSTKRLELARRQLGYTELSAPSAGAIAAVDVVVNENVRAGQSIVHLVSLGSDLEVAVTMPESLITGVRRRDAVQVTFDALPGESFEARVTEVGVAATGTATTFPVIARLEGQDPRLRAGMAAEVSFRFATASASRVRLPPHVVGEDREGRFVWVVETSDGSRGTARRHAVTIGELTASGLEILDGVGDGDVVVTAGINSLTEGEPVRLSATD